MICNCYVKPTPLPPLHYSQPPLPNSSSRHSRQRKIVANEPVVEKQISIRSIFHLIQASGLGITYLIKARKKRVLHHDEIN